MNSNKSNIKSIQKFVGPITEEHLSHVDFYCSANIGMIIPATDSCKYCRAVMHDHPSYSFVLHFDDSYILEIEGQKFETRQGKLTAISPKIIHAHHEQSSEKFSRYAAIFVSEKYFHEQLAVYPELELRRFAGEAFDSGPEILSNVKEFIFEADNRMPGYLSLLEAIGLKLTHSIIRTAYNVSIPSQKTNIRLNIDQVIQFMHGHYQEKINTNQLAQCANLSLSHFSRIFKNETGKSPVDYLINLRLNKAKKLLQFNESSITEIALACGFSSASHFSSYFQKSFGIPPLKFRQSFQ